MGSPAQPFIDLKNELDPSTWKAKLLSMLGLGSKNVQGVQTQANTYQMNWKPDPLPPDQLRKYEQGDAASQPRRKLPIQKAVN